MEKENVKRKRFGRDDIFQYFGDNLSCPNWNEMILNSIWNYDNALQILWDIKVWFSCLHGQKSKLMKCCCTTMLLQLGFSILDISQCPDLQMTWFLQHWKAYELHLLCFEQKLIQPQWWCVWAPKVIYAWIRTNLWTDPWSGPDITNDFAPDISKFFYVLSLG